MAPAGATPHPSDFVGHLPPQGGKDRCMTLAPPQHTSGWLCLSPMNRRRLDNFRRNRRGYWSFWIFMALFVVSLGAEFVANDRPLIAAYNGELLFPVLIDYPEDKFG